MRLYKLCSFLDDGGRPLPVAVSSTGVPVLGSPCNWEQDIVMLCTGERGSEEGPISVYKHYSHPSPLFGTVLRASKDPSFWYNSQMDTSMSYKLRRAAKESCVTECFVDAPCAELLSTQFVDLLLQWVSAGEDALEYLDSERSLGIDQNRHRWDSESDSLGEFLLSKLYIVGQTSEHLDCVNAKGPSLKNAWLF